MIICFVVPENNRVFHYAFAAILLAGSITYFAEAADLGWSTIHQSNNINNGDTRQVFFAKYINWAVTFPTTALSLGLLSGISWTTILLNMFLSCFWVISYLVAAFTTTSYKWGFFAFGTLAWLILAASTINESHEAASRLGIGRDYRLLSLWINVLWTLYLIAFGLGDGGNVIGITESFIFYGILDILFLPLYTGLFLYKARQWDYIRLHIAFSEHRFDPNGVLESAEQLELTEPAIIKP